MKQKHYDLVLIRHAQSLFNEATCIQANALNLQHLSWDELIENEKFNKAVTYSKLYMDPPLSQHGRKQCLKFKEQCAKIKPDLILVSPYRRSLETCHLLFGNTKAPVIVDPILAQVFRFTCDVPNLLEENKKLYPHYDYSKIQKLGNDWYLTNLQEKIKQKIATKLKENNINQFSKKRDILLEMLSVKQIHEAPRMLRARTVLIKKQLAEYRKKYSMIVVVAHYYIIEFLKSRGFDKDGDLLAYHDIPNCYPFYEQLTELQKIL